MFDIAWSTIKGRKGGFIAAFIAVFCGAAVVTACGILFESGLRSGVPAERYGAATVLIGGKQTLDIPEDIDPYYAERVMIPANLGDRLQGMGTVVPERSFDISVGSAAAYGHGWSSSVLGPFTLTEGHEPRGANETVLDSELAARAGLKAGSKAQVAIGSTPTEYTVVGLAQGSLHRQSAAFFTDAQAATLSGRPDQVTAIGVLSEQDPDALAARIENALSGADIVTYTGTDIGDGEFLDVGQSRTFLVALSGSFGGTAIAVVMFVVASTLGLSIQQRRRELAMLRAVGATPRQIHKMIGAETLVVAAAGGLLGSIPGFFVAGLLRDAFASIGVLPGDFELAFGPLPALASLLLCVGGVRVAGYIAAFRTARIRPVEALGEAAAEPRKLGKARIGIGVALLAIGFAAAIVLPLVIPGEGAIIGASSSVILLMAGTALIGPRLVRGTTGVFGPLLNRSRVSGFLAAANTHANSRRLSGAITPLALGMAMASVQMFTLTTVSATASAQAQTGVVADYVVSSSTSGLSPDVAEEIRRLPGVQAVTPVTRTQVLMKYTEQDKLQATPYPAQGVTPETIAQTLDLDVRSGRLEDLKGDTIALSRMAAGTAGVEVGETVSVSLGDGTGKNLRVVAIYGNGLGFGDVTLPYSELIQHTTTRLDNAVLVRGDVGPALSTLIQHHVNTHLASRTEFTAVQQASLDQQSYTNLIANALLLLYIMIAVVNTLVMATAARSREFAMLRLVGTTRRQVQRMMFFESWVVVATAVIVGSAVAIPPLVGVSMAMTESFLPHISLIAYLGIVGVTALLGLLSIVIPARSTMRTRPIHAIGIGE